MTLEESMRKIVIAGCDLLDTFIEYEDMQRSPQEWRQAIYMYLAEQQLKAAKHGDEAESDRYMYTMMWLVTHWRVKLLSKGVMEDRADDEVEAAQKEAQSVAEADELATLKRERDEAREVLKLAMEIVDYVADTLPMRNCDADEPSSFPIMRAWVSESMILHARDIQVLRTQRKAKEQSNPLRERLNAAIEKTDEEDDTYL